MAGPDGISSNRTAPATSSAPATNTTSADAAERRAAAAAATPASPSRGVTVPTQPGDTVATVRQRAFAKMADEAGLTPTAKVEFVARAQQLDDGTLNAPAATAGAQARARTPQEAQAAITRGEVTVAPTTAQAGLLNLMRSDVPDNALACPVPGAAAGFALPAARNSVPGQSAVTPEVAQAILENVSKGQPPFKPELGEVGGVSWFVTGGDPHTGTSTAKNVEVPVEISNTSGKPALQFGEKELLEIYQGKFEGARAEAETQLRQRTGKTNGEPLSNTNLKEIDRNASRLAERQMWTEVGERVRASESGIGKVTLENSRFSKSGNGEFTLTSKAENVRLAKNGTAKLLDVIKTEAKPVEPGVLEAAEKLATQEKWGGRVQGAFRVGGKVLIVVGVATDAYRIYTATDKVKTTVEVAGGWAGATAAGAAFAAWYTPADVAGPWAWLGHGVGTLAAGGVGYFLGSEAAKTIYELTVEGKPIEVGR